MALKVCDCDHIEFSCGFDHQKAEHGLPLSSVKTRLSKPSSCRLTDCEQERYDQT